MPDRIHEDAIVGRNVQVTKQYHVKLKGLHCNFWRREELQKKRQPLRQRFFESLERRLIRERKSMHAVDARSGEWRECVD